MLLSPSDQLRQIFKRGWSSSFLPRFPASAKIFGQAQPVEILVNLRRQHRNRFLLSRTGHVQIDSRYRANPVQLLPWILVHSIPPSCSTGLSTKTSQNASNQMGDRRCITARAAGTLGFFADNYQKPSKHISI